MKKYTYKDSGIEWLGKIPEHWEINRLKRHASFKNGVNFSTLQRGYGTITLDVLNMYGGITTNFDRCYRVNNKNNDQYLLVAGDVLFVRSSVKREGVGWCSMFESFTEPVQYCGFIIRSRFFTNQINSKFITYYLQSHLGREQIILDSTTVTITNISQDKLGKVFFPLPPLQEQKAIAEYLDKATARIDRIIAIKQEQLVKMEEMFKDKVTAILSGLNSKNNKKTNLLWVKEIPSHWKLSKLSHLIEVKDGTHDTPSYEYSGENNFPFVTSKDITENEIDFSYTKFISPEYHNNYFRRSNPKRGDIIMPMIGTIGNSAIVNTDIEFSIKNVALFKTSESLKINTKFLFYFLESELNMNQFYLESKGGVQTFLSLTVLRNLKIILPPKDEQDEIVKLLDIFSTKLKSTKANIKSQIETLQAYRKSLIHECVTGKKIIVND